MTRPVKLYDLAPSPNNVKVRLALSYKRIPYERIPVDPQVREPIIKVSGQPLASVLLHGDTVVYDSYAILRYLDANWPGPPRLFSADREAMRRIEEWELFNRTEVGSAIGIVFREWGSSDPDRERIRKANDRIQGAALRLEEVLSETPCLMGDSPNAADLTVAPMIRLGALPPEARDNPIGAFFLEHLKIQAAPKMRQWIDRVMALEKASRPA